MKNIRPLFGLLAFAALPALSQQLQQPSVPATKPATTAPRDPGAGPQLKQAQPSQVPKVSADPNQRPQAPAAVPSSGPANEVPTGPAASRSPVKVLDTTGKPVNGLIQVAPNRVLDPATGRYHWTDGSGEKQKLLD